MSYVNTVDWLWVKNGCCQLDLRICCGKRRLDGRDSGPFLMYISDLSQLNDTHLMQSYWTSCTVLRLFAQKFDTILFSKWRSLAIFIQLSVNDFNGISIVAEANFPCRDHVRSSHYLQSYDDSVFVSIWSSRTIIEQPKSDNDDHKARHDTSKKPWDAWRTNGRRIPSRRLRASFGQKRHDVGIRAPLLVRLLNCYHSWLVAFFKLCSSSSVDKRSTSATLLLYLDIQVLKGRIVALNGSILCVHRKVVNYRGYLLLDNMSHIMASTARGGRLEGKKAIITGAAG